MTYIPPVPASKPRAYDLRDFISEVIDPNLMIIRGISGKDNMWTAEAKQEILTICLQETDLRYRRQHPSGPARGFAQFEGGQQQALDLIMRHDVVGPWLHEYAASVVLPFSLEELYTAMQYHDGLVIVAARLLLYTDYRSMTMDQDIGYEIYDDCWQPGAKRPEDWPNNWARAYGVLAENIA